MNDDIQTTSVNNGGSSGNSTTVPLNSGQFFVGNAETTQVYNCISVTLTCDTTATVTIQQSLDRVNWDVSEIFAYTPGGTTDMTFIQDIVLPFYRVIEKNTSGATMGYNRLTTILFSTQKDVRITDVLGAVTVVQPNAALLQATVTGSLISVGTITNPVTVNGTLTSVGSITNPVTVSSVTNPVTVSSVTNPVTVSSITNPVTVSSITNPVTVSSVTSPVTVNGTLTSVGSITNPVTVNGTLTSVDTITNPITVSGIQTNVYVLGSLTSVDYIVNPISVSNISDTVKVNLRDSSDSYLTANRGTATNNVLSIQRSIDIRTPVTVYATAVAAGTTGNDTVINMTKILGNSGTPSTAAFFSVTSGKIMRINSIVFGTLGNTTTATAQNTVFTLRRDASSAPANTLIQGRCATTAVISAIDRVVMPLGLELESGINFAMWARATYTTNAPTWDVIINGFEY
jgi:hypothetical protein